ncbi:MAG: hypothetical protein CMM90_04850 [Rickettsiales bacterium]|nr:hypothetical protein [Rickettsiales bacterium]
MTKVYNFFFFLFLFFIYIILSNKNIYNTLFVDIAHNDSKKFYFYFVINILFFVSFFLCLLLKNSIIKFILCISFLFSSFVSQVFNDISGNIININDIEIALINLDSLGNFVQEYSSTILPNFFILIYGFLLLILFKISRPHFNNGGYIYSGLALLICLLVSLSINRGGFATQGLPSQLQVVIPIPSLLITKNFEFNHEKIIIKEEKNENIVLIIDESVSYEFFKKAIEIDDSENKYFNNIKKFYSIHNCSAQSVFSLMNGLKFKDEKIIIRKNLWVIAKENGYETIYLSGQEKENNYQYLQSPNDIRNIDKKIFFNKYDHKKRDKEILKNLIQILEKEKKKFVVVIKNGSHFPYHNKFDLEKYGLNKEDNNELIYTYSLKENSVEFLKTLFLNVDEHSKILYLSDHGQAFQNKSFKHCNSTNPSINEWEVPFIYYDMKGNNIKDINNLELYDLVLSLFGIEREIFKSSANYLFYGNLNTRYNTNLNFKKIR